MYFREAKQGRLAHENFIARKLFLRDNENKKVSRPIVRISVISIALAIVVNLLTIAVVVGFQKQVREKVSGFSAHATLSRAGATSIVEGEPLLKNRSVEQKLQKESNVAAVQAVAYKPILLQSDVIERNIRTKGKADTVLSQREIQGALFKGVNESYDWSFLQENLVEGTLPNLKVKEMSIDILLSQTLAEMLRFKVGDTINAFYVRKAPVKRPFRISGIYDTGLKEFDKKMIFGDLRQVQTMSDWGLRAELEVLDSLNEGYYVVKANISGGSGYYEYDWGKGFGAAVGIKICPTQDTSFRLIAREFKGYSNQPIGQSLPDTAWIKIKPLTKIFQPCGLSDQSPVREDLDGTGDRFKMSAEGKTVQFEITQGKGNAQDYIGGYELLFKNWSEMESTIAQLKKKFAFVPNQRGEIYQVTGIVDSEAEIFMWLDFLDLNILIILILMITIGIVNVGAALLILILVKTSFIGMLKAMGSVNWQIRKIFLLQTGYLILRGMLWGNAIGLTFCYLQYQFGWMKLNASVYYLREVPIVLEIWHVVVLNVVTLAVCILAMVIPSSLIARIQPTQAIKFQ